MDKGCGVVLGFGVWYDRGWEMWAYFRFLNNEV